jgi:hypothetical protein
MPQLITPIAELHDSWLRARDEFGIGVHQDGAGLRTTDEVTTPEGLASALATCGRADSKQPPAPHAVEVAGRGQHRSSSHQWLHV